MDYPLSSANISSHINTGSRRAGQRRPTWLYLRTVTSSFTKGLQVDCIYLDFAKAFDTVSHIHLLHKLEAYGLTGPLLSFIRSYLSNRFLVVRYSSAFSEPISVISGVPQGSLLGPFLFILFINDIVDLLDVLVLLFADDLKLLCMIATKMDNARLQSNIDLILLWCKLNSMDLNVRKCVVMHFTRSPHKIVFDYRIGQHILGSVSEVRDLGVYFTPNLHPGLHISRVYAKAYSVSGFIFRSTRGFSFSTIKTLYMTLVRSILEYNSPVWSPYQLGLVTC
jgi:ribonuclease P/MRP protein subunit RPP40